MWQTGAEIFCNLGVIRQKRGPVYVEWHIENFFSYTKGNECLRSPNFFVCDETNWYLQIHPNVEKETADYISFCLMKDTSNEKYHIAYKLGILNSNDSVVCTTDWLEYEFERRVQDTGYLKFVPRSDLLKSKDTIASGGVLRVFCLIRSVDNTVVKEAACGTRCPRSLDVLTQNFQDLYVDERLSDVTVTVKNRDFKAHKCILASRSPVFAAMFENDMVEKKSSAISITDCDPGSFKEFLFFLYTGKLENVSPSNVFGLYGTAHKYDVKELEEECLQIMEHNLSVDTFMDAILVAVKYNETELLKSATEFFIESAEEILPTVKWQSFMAENSCLANELFMKFVKRKSVAEDE